MQPEQTPNQKVIEYISSSVYNLAKGSILPNELLGSSLWEIGGVVITLVVFFFTAREQIKISL
ncbi:hypothetical protein IJG04_00885 [Candidatus Saccharibacteria bacterium]|nr:hypothetical protein [Candidatus Saccharibacteria bacterium]